LLEKFFWTDAGVVGYLVVNWSETPCEDVRKDPSYDFAECVGVLWLEVEPPALAFVLCVNVLLRYDAVLADFILIS